LGKQNKNDLAEKYRINRTTLFRWFKIFWKEEIKPKNIDISNLILIIDGKFISRNVVCFIGIVNKKVVFWKFDNGENYLTWTSFLLSLKKIPFCIVCDGQRGMLKAIKQLFPRLIIQRCQFHVISYCLTKLTRNPKSLASQDLRLLILELSKVKNKNNLDNWLKEFTHWYLKNALPYLFQYVKYPNIPNTTNQLEGGINSQIQHLIVNHRGFNLNRRKYLISLFLSKKQ